MEKNKLWLFGCSFTYGSGIRLVGSGNRDYKEDKSDNDFYWGNQYEGLDYGSILGKKLGLEVQNFGIEGASNFDIELQLINNLPNIQPKDVVIIGQTTPIRESIVFNDIGSPGFKTFNLHPYAVEQLQNPTSIEFQSFFNSYSDLEKESMYDSLAYFYLNVITKQEYGRGQYYSNKFKSIAKHLQKLNVETVVWEYSIWDLLENIEIWTEVDNPVLQVRDGHWSPNGHAGLAFCINYLLENTKNRYINYQTLIQTERVLFKFLKQHKYIPFEPKTTP